MKYFSKSGLTQKEKRRKRYSDNFNEIFTFFYKSYRVGILDFCGVDVLVIKNINSQEAKFCFRKFDNGEYTKNEVYCTGIPTKHPNLLKAIITGKKAWGLFLNEWSSGIAERNFTLNEIVAEFSKYNIVIPDSLMLDFNNRIRKKKGTL